MRIPGNGFSRLARRYSRYSRTPNGRTFRVRGKGAPRRDGTKADLLVTVDVELPTTLDDTSRAAVEAFREAQGTHDPRAGLIGRAQGGSR